MGKEKGLLTASSFLAFCRDQLHAILLQRGHILHSQETDKCGRLLWLSLEASTAPEQQGALFALEFVLNRVGSQSWRAWETQQDQDWKNML